MGAPEPGRRTCAVVGVLVLAVVVVVGGFWLFDDSRTASQAVAALPEQALRLQNAEGAVVELTVRNASSLERSHCAFNCVREDVVQSTVLFSATPFAASAPITVERLQVPIEMIFFCGAGEFLEMRRFEPGEKELYAPERGYRYHLEAKDGFSAEFGIAPGSSLLL